MLYSFIVDNLFQTIKRNGACTLARYLISVTSDTGTLCYVEAIAPCAMQGPSMLLHPVNYCLPG